MFVWNECKKKSHYTNWEKKLYKVSFISKNNPRMKGWEIPEKFPIQKKKFPWNFFFVHSRGYSGLFESNREEFPLKKNVEQIFLLFFCFGKKKNFIFIIFFVLKNKLKYAVLCCSFNFYSFSFFLLGKILDDDDDDYSEWMNKWYARISVSISEFCFGFFWL